MLRLPQPENFFDLRQMSFLVQLLERRVPRLVQGLQGSGFTFFRCRACLGCFPLSPGGVGRFSGRLFSSVGGFPLRVLAGWRELLRHPFGRLTFHPRPLGFRRSACLPGSLGLLAGLPVAFDLLWSIRPATRSRFPELLHLPEFLGSILRPHYLTQLREPFPRSVGAIQLVRPYKLQLLRYQRLAEFHGAECVSARNDHMLKLVAEIAGHVLKLFGYLGRYLLAGYRLPSATGQHSGVQTCSLFC